MANSFLARNVAGEIEFSLAKEGVYVFSNASAQRMDSKVPRLCTLTSMVVKCAYMQGAYGTLWIDWREEREGERDRPKKKGIRRSIQRTKKQENLDNKGGRENGC